MRTTVRLDDDLLRQAKALAPRTGRTLTAVIEAIESGSEWMTSDRDYSRFPGLRWRDPAA